MLGSLLVLLAVLCLVSVEAQYMGPMGMGSMGMRLMGMGGMGSGMGGMHSSMGYGRRPGMMAYGPRPAMGMGGEFLVLCLNYEKLTRPKRYFRGSNLFSGN